MATTYPWVSPTGELSAVSGGIEWAIPGTAGNVAVSTGVIPMGLVSVDVRVVQARVPAADKPGFYFGYTNAWNPPTVQRPAVAAPGGIAPRGPGDSPFMEVPNWTVGVTRTVQVMHPGGVMTLSAYRGGVAATPGKLFFSSPRLDAFVAPGPPTITKLIPTSGPDTGGTVAYIVGTDLTGATAVDFGGTAGTGLTVDPSGSLATVTTPAHTAGPAPVTITTPAGTSAAETFTFEAPLPPGPPTITKLIPTSGPDTGGTTVDIIGGDLTGATAVDFGSTPGTGLTVDPSGSLATVTSPAHTAGPAPVTITTPAGVSNAETFTFEAPLPPGPVVVAVIPGAALPGATIQIVGTNLTDATVTMCGDPVAIVSNDGTIITVVVPPGCPDGPATITVTTPDGETTAGLTVLPPEPVPPADVSPRSWQIAQALLDAAFLCGAECARAFVTTDATPEGPPPGGCPCQLTATIVKDGYKTADGRRLVRSATIKLSLHQCTPIPQADEIPDPDTESDYALRQAETRDQMLRGLATARRQPSSVLGRCQTKQASEGWVHVSTTGGMSLYTMEVTVD